MDSIATAGVRFTQFQVSPVCSPTRSSLMTGRYNYRTGIVDTYLGRSMMYPDEVTMAELFGRAGYRTGIFGKWHLGDNYPMRAIDQGFEEALVLKGGGLAQPSDPPESAGSYFDPVLQHNGRPERPRGYCSDIFFDAATSFVEANRRRPFLAYISPNAPHTPLQVDEKWVAPYRRAGLGENVAKLYGMVANLDENIGQLLAALDRLELARDTIVVFLTDNGPQGQRYNAGLRGLKGTVYQGGIRVPCFLRWPGTVAPGSPVDRIAAHIDLLPTLLEACGIPRPPDLKLDGRSLMPLLGGKSPHWPDRTLYTQWHRGDEPVLYRACAARTQQYKLVDGKELYDLDADPGETHDIAAANPQIVARMRRGYEDWFRDVSATRGYALSRIYIGDSHENPVVLSQQDWRGPRAGAGRDAVGYWEVDVRSAARYQVRLIAFPADAGGEALLRLNGAEVRRAFSAGATEIELGEVSLPAGPGRLEAILRSGARESGVRFVEMRRS